MENKEFIELDDVPINNDNGCDWYFYEDTSKDGYTVWISTNNPENIVPSENVFYYPYDFEFFKEIVNQPTIKKIGWFFDEELLQVKEIAEACGVDFDDEEY